MTALQHAIPEEIASDGHDRNFTVFLDLLAAAINTPRPLSIVPEQADSRNFPWDAQNFATALLRSAMVHTATGGTAQFRIYYYHKSFTKKIKGTEQTVRPEAMFIADMTITYAGGVAYGYCPITGLADPSQSGESFSCATSRWYKASSVSAWTSQFNTDVIDTLRDATTAAASEVQTIDLDSASGGTYTLTVTVNGVSATTSALAYNASDGTIQTALQALSNVGSGGITVSSLAMTFAGNLAAQEHALVTLDKTSLTGGGGGATVTRTTRGLSPEAIFRLDQIKHGILVAVPIAMSGSRVMMAAAPWQK